MKKTVLLVALAASLATAHGSSNIIPAHELMFHSIVADNAQSQLAKAYPEYARYLDDTDVLLLLNFIHTTDKAVIVKFSADWCKPCRRLQPIVHEAAEDFDSDLVVIEVDYDEHHELRQMFDIEAVPTLIYFKNGREIERTHGMGKQALLDKIKKLINTKTK